jgi:AcrR family transcriptional regulator
MPIPGTTDQRSRILDAALRLMSEQGSTGASMRQLAQACDLNVATLYHYFPSKADLLRSVITERRYGERLKIDRPPINASVPTRPRLVELLEWLWHNTLDEEAVWRLLVGEGLHGEGDATAGARAAVAELEGALAGWLDTGFPEIPGDHVALARVICGQVFGLIVEHLAIGDVNAVRSRQRAEDLALLIVP